MPVRYPKDIDADDTDWYNNSFDALLETSDQYNMIIDTLYEEIYNVKVIYNNFENQKMQIEFPSEEEAIAFIMRWS